MEKELKKIQQHAEMKWKLESYLTETLNTDRIIGKNNIEDNIVINKLINRSIPIEEVP